MKCRHFYRTRVRSLATLVSDSLTLWRLVELIDVTLAMPNQNLLMLLLLPMLMIIILMATV